MCLWEPHLHVHANGGRLTLKIPSSGSTTHVGPLGPCNSPQAPPHPQGTHSKVFLPVALPPVSPSLQAEFSRPFCPVPAPPCMKHLEGESQALLPRVPTGRLLVWVPRGGANPQVTWGDGFTRKRVLCSVPGP